jgi:hypothetical protein
MADGEPTKSTCFIIMPISDVEGYDSGHFGRVYEFIIKPACKAAGFKPIRADEVQVTNYIVVDILRKILDADMVVCDLSARNSNVLYELGIRQAFNRPVTLIRDSRTPRIFDIQGLRDLEYDESLRIDKITSAVESLTNLLKNTSQLSEGDVNSIIQLLGVKPAQVSSVEDSKDTSLVLNAISDISKRMSRLEDFTRVESLDVGLPARKTRPSRRSIFALKNGLFIAEGIPIAHPEYGQGIVRSIDSDSICIRFKEGFDFKFLIGSSEIERLQHPTENNEEGSS